MSKTITREYLENHGISVTEDGRVFRNGVEKTQVSITTIHPLGKDKTYPAIGVYDAELYKKRGQMTNILLVSRVVWAWYNGVTPASLEVDHLDGNSWNNHISNLRLVDRKTNNNNKVRQGNQFLVNLNDADYTKYVAKRDELQEDVKTYRAKWKSLSEELKTLKKGYKEDLAKCKHESQVELVQENFEKQEADLQEQIFIYKAKWHDACKAYKEFKKENKLGE